MVTLNVAFNAVTCTWCSSDRRRVGLHLSGYHDCRTIMLLPFTSDRRQDSLLIHFPYLLSWWIDDKCILPITQRSVLAMASPSLTFLENYHWKGYTVDPIINNSNTMVCLHRGNFPMHRHCKYGNRVCAFQSSRGMGMDTYGEVEHPTGG